MSFSEKEQKVTHKDNVIYASVSYPISRPVSIVLKATHVKLKAHMNLHGIGGQ